MSRTALIFLLTLALVSVTAANEIVIESEGDQQYLAFVASDPVKIAGYNIQLNYSADTEILSAGPLEPYTGVYKIENGAGWTRIIGFTGGDTYSSRLAGFTYSGKGDFSIVVYELYDSDLNDVTVSNTMGTVPEATGSPTPTIPEYRPDPGYVSPTGAASGPTPITGGSAGLPVVTELVSTPSPEPTASAKPSPSPARTEGSTPTASASLEMTAQSPHTGTTPEAPLSVMSVISAIVIVGFCFTNIRKHI
ncbi:MAG: hypothetical protein XE11_2376 [Methanomicrobiales archaeon 53_19]|nr:MAG: hypothetical protein XE11_2376 [Methanomicrobiales archaeon 53_19]